MALTDFLDVVDKPDWRIIAPQLNASVAGGSIAYDSTGENGKFAYINLNGTQFFYRFNIFTMDIGEWVYIRQSQGTPVAGGRMWTGHTKDKAGNKVSTLNHLQSSGVLQHECFITT